MKWLKKKGSGDGESETSVRLPQKVDLAHALLSLLLGGPSITGRG
jgi:hypothetical protein